MTSNKYAQTEKQRSPAATAASHTSIKDGDLQIQIPDLDAMSNVDKMERFKALHTRLERNWQAHQTAVDAALKPSQDNPKKAMEEAQSTYDSMMEIRKQLNQAYQEFISMQ